MTPILKLWNVGRVPCRSLADMRQIPKARRSASDWVCFPEVQYGSLSDVSRSLSERGEHVETPLRCSCQVHPFLYFLGLEFRVVSWLQGF